MERTVISTTTGCAGLGLEHGETVWIADTAAEFAAGIRTLLDDGALRARIAQSGRAHAAKHFDWRAIGVRQRALLRELLGDPLTIRKATRDDLARIAAIQNAAPEAAWWDPAGYLDYDCAVAVTHDLVIGFAVSRQTAPGEREILNVAVDPRERRRGIGRRLLEQELTGSRAEWYLEVRESNAAAINLYESFGFEVAGRREAYYRDPAEAAIVMRFFS